MAAACRREVAGPGGWTAGPRWTRRGARRGGYSFVKRSGVAWARAVKRRVALAHRHTPATGPPWRSGRAGRPRPQARRDMCRRSRSERPDRRMALPVRRRHLLPRPRASTRSTPSPESLESGTLQIGRCPFRNGDQERANRGRLIRRTGWGTANTTPPTRTNAVRRPVRRIAMPVTRRSFLGRVHGALARVPPSGDTPWIGIPITTPPGVAYPKTAAPCLRAQAGRRPNGRTTVAWPPGPSGLGRAGPGRGRAPPAQGSAGPAGNAEPRLAWLGY